jgi:response regulator RpfG family c-di-GMP phosphodiesterase
LDVLGCAIAERDSDTNTHNYRVTLYALGFGRRLGLSGRELRDLIAGAFLHDIGKIGIRDPILLKPGRLTLEEFETMKPMSPWASIFSAGQAGSRARATWSSSIMRNTMAAAI